MSPDALLIVQADLAALAASTLRLPIDDLLAALPADLTTEPRLAQVRELALVARQLRDVAVRHQAAQRDAEVRASGEG